MIIAAGLASQEWLAWMVRQTSGFICAPMTNEIADRLELPVMVANNQDARGTNYTVSVDAADRITTGISASDRAHTLRVLANLESTPREPAPARPHHAAPGGGWRRARARRSHRGRRRPAQAGRSCAGRCYLRDRGRGRRDDASARPHRARRGRGCAGDHHRGTHRVPAADALRQRRADAGGTA